MKLYKVLADEPVKGTKGDKLVARLNYFYTAATDISDALESFSGVVEIKELGAVFLSMDAYAALRNEILRREDQ